MKTGKHLSFLFFLCLVLCPQVVEAQFSAPKRSYVDYIVNADHADRNYRTGEKATITVRANKGGFPLDGTMLYYRLGDDKLLPKQQDSVVFRNGVAVIKLGTMRKPGFRAVDLSFTVDKKYGELVKVGFDVDKIMPSAPVPEDFDAFWQNTMAAFNAVPLRPEVIPLPKYSTEKVEVSLVKLTFGADGRHFYGYLTRPKDGQKHPVLFQPPGAGANRLTPTTFYSEAGYIFFAIAIHNDLNPEVSDDLFAAAKAKVEGYNRFGIESRETFYYRNVYAGCARCIDFLTSLDDWDGKNIGVAGGSQGGALSIVTAALNKKVTFCAPFYPALCDLLGHYDGRPNLDAIPLRSGGWPQYFAKEEKAGAAETLPYYDVCSFATRLRCPVFMSFGYGDDTCPPTSTYACFNAITAPKTLDFTLTNGHWRFTESNDKAMAWMKQQLCN